MRVLLIAYSYPPDPMVGAFRPAKVVRALLEAGHEVEVVTARMSGESTRIRQEEARLRVHTVRALPNPRHGYLWLRSQWRRLSGRNVENKGTGGVPQAGSMATAAPGGWKRLLISLLWVPDENQGFIPAAVLRSLLICRRRVDLIYTTAPPFSDHLVGRALKALTGARWAMELRDPWTHNASRPPEARSAPAARFNAWLEAVCLDSADHVIAVSPVLEQLDDRLATGSKKRLALVLNGIDRIATELPQRRNDSLFHITHTGSLYNDPRPFMKVVARVAERLQLGPDQLRVEFIGARPHFAAPTVEELAAELGIADHITFSGWIHQDECRLRIEQSNLLLLLCEGFPTAIPNKLFDYLGARKPILAIVDPGSESERILSSLDGHFVASSSDLDRADAFIECAFRERRADHELLDDEDFLRSWSTRHQMDRLLSVIIGRPDPTLGVNVDQRSGERAVIRT